MRNSVRRRRLLSLTVAGLVALVGVVWFVYDAVFWALAVAAVGLIWSSRERKAWLLAAVMVAAGLLLSSVEQTGCSAWARSSVLYRKLKGDFPYIRWQGMARLAFGPCYEVSAPSWWTPNLRQLEEKTVAGQKWGLYQTELGPLWFPPPGERAVRAILWEITVQQTYDCSQVAVRPGDTVIDCGAHVGVFCRYALHRGAKRVIAIEPDPTNLVCLEANLAQEIADGRVEVLKVGVWNEPSHMTLYHFDENSYVHSFVTESPAAKKVVDVPVLPLDQIVDQLGLEQVDFIKMDIEGAERQALQGATRTLARFRPRMAISSYHLPDDVGVITEITRQAQPSYQVLAKDVEYGDFGVTTKVLFFE